GSETRFDLRRGLRPLRRRNYALYWAGVVAANSGRWMELTGSVWIAFDLTETPSALGLLRFARAASAFFLSPRAGVVVDRVEQRRILMVTQATSLLVSITLAALVAAGRIEIWHIYLGVALQTTITAFDTTARQTLFPRLVPRDELTEAVTLTISAAR